MNFTILCNNCGQTQVLETEKFKNLTSIDITITTGWHDTADVSIECKHCKNHVYDDNEYHS